MANQELQFWDKATVSNQELRFWDASQMPRLDGRTAVVTGANSGIGFETALHLALRGAHVILACRSQERGFVAEQRIRSRLLAAKFTGTVKLLLVDLSEPASVSAFAREVRGRFRRLDLLVNNAGVSVSGPALNSSGVESHFASNVLGHFQLTLEFVALLLASPNARVVGVSSLVHRSVDDSVDVASFGDGPGGRWVDYAHSKLAVLLFTRELQRRLEACGVKNVVAVAAHPGVCQTPLFDKFCAANLPPWLLPAALSAFYAAPFQSPYMGALPTLYAAVAPEVNGGEYFGPDRWHGWVGHPVKEQPSGTSQCQDKMRKLWARCEQALGARFDVEAAVKEQGALAEEFEVKKSYSSNA